ncbi:MAG: NAD(P)/FAD-dependent oxidoreductase [Gemmatimonadales bacterium]
MTPRTQPTTDITIIGGGPTGLFGAFYAGMRGASCRIVDALPELGGQLMALYPEKHIYDVAGFTKVLAKDLVAAMVHQGLQFGATAHLGQTVTGLKRETRDGEELFILDTTADTYPTRTIVLAAGIGAFAPRTLPLEGSEAWEGKGLRYHIREPAELAGQRVLLVGGGDSAFDWALHLHGVARSVTLIHRRDQFRAHQATIDRVQSLVAQGEAAVRTFTEVTAIHGTARIDGVTLRHAKTGAEDRIGVDAIIPLLGFHSDLGAINAWGLDTEKADIKVSTVMETNVPGIYAAGDVVTYPGKLKLIATGVAEACTAVNNAVHRINPKAKVNPGHSSDLKIFEEDPAKR